jgi:nitrogen fixation protein FixH
MTHTFKGWHMAVITGSFFAVIIAVNITLAIFAKSSWTGLVVENSYVASQSFNHDATIAKQQHAAGWTLDLEVTRDNARVAVHSRANLPLRGLSVRMKLQRPTTDTEDRVLDLAEAPANFYSTIASIQPGVWIADITAEGNDHQPVRFVRRIFVK